MEKMGRPPISGKPMKQVSGIFLTLEQIQWIKKVESEQHITRSEYIRSLIQKEMNQTPKNVV